MGGSEKRKSSGKKAGKSDQSVNTYTANKTSSSMHMAESLMEVPSSDLSTHNLHDYRKQDTDPDKFMLAEK